MALDLTETNDDGDRWWILKHTHSNATAWLIFGSLEYAISEVARLQRSYDDARLHLYRWSTTLAETFPVAPNSRIIVHNRGNSTQRGEYQ